MISLLLFAIAVTHATVPDSTILQTLSKVDSTLATALNSTLPGLNQAEACECRAFEGYAVDAFKNYRSVADNCGSNTTCVDAVCNDVKTDATAPCMQFFYNSATDDTRTEIDGLNTTCSARNISIAFNNTCKNTSKGFTVFAANTGNTVALYTVVEESYSGAELVNAGNSFYVTAYKDGKTNMAQRLQVVINGTAVNLVVNFAKQSLTSVNESFACSNGFVHVLKAALAPPMNVSATLKELNQTALADKLGLDSTANVTVLIPTDAAVANFTQLGSLSDKGQGRVLMTHEVPAVVFSSDLKDNATAQTKSGATLRVHIRDGSVAFSVADQTANSTVVTADVLTSGGVIHVIDHVLVWESDSDLDPVDSILVRPKLSEFAEKILEANATKDFKETLRKCVNCTIFAPTNDAFKGNLSGVDALAVLQYHVATSAILSKDLKSFNRAESYLNKPSYVKLDGLSQSIIVTKTNQSNTTDVRVQFGFPEKKEYATVVLADQNASGSVIHEIDTILSIPANTTATATRGGFSAMVELVTGLNLTHTLDDGYTKKINNTNKTGIKPYTLFVASNKRYNDAGFDVTANSTDKVLNQAINGMLYSVDFVSLANKKNGTNGTRGFNITMLGGAKYTVAFNNKSELTVGGHKILQTNILTANGVVHVLDGVLGVKNNNSSGLSAGVWAAIIVGGLAVLALLCYCFSQACKDDSTSAERRPFATLADQE